MRDRKKYKIIWRNSRGHLRQSIVLKEHSGAYCSLMLQQGYYPAVKGTVMNKLLPMQYIIRSM
jgi:hypothetical protein